MASEKRLIDANGCPCIKCDRLGKCRPGFCEAFAEWWLSPVDAVEVVHGHWVDFADKHEKSARRHDFRCSVCNNRASKFVGGIEDWWDLWKPNYCPHCGAKMRGGEE